MRDTREKLTGTTVTLHWLIGLAIIGNLIGGLYVDDLPRGEAKSALIGFHKSIGMLILLFALWRLGWRASQGLLAPVGTMPAWQNVLHKMTLAALLLGTVALPLSGIYYSVSSGYPIAVFGIPVIPKILSGADVTKAGADFAFQIHSTLAFVLIGVITLHVAGALKHHVIDRDGTLRRMLGARVDAR